MTSNPILRPQNRRSQISSTPNSPFRPNNMPAMRPPCGISWQKRPNKTQRKVEWEVDNPFTRPQTARASFHPPDRNQSRPAHQIASGTSYVSAHPGPKHLDRKAAPAQPAFRTPGISNTRHFPHRPPDRKQHADATPAKPLAAYPTPCQPNLQLHVHQTSNASPTRPFAFSRKSSRAFPCRGQDARTAARPKRIPRRKRSPPWSSKHLNAATATKFSTRNTPPRCCGPNAPIAEAEHIRTRPPHLPHAASSE